jgi:hypothetical protein
MRRSETKDVGFVSLIFEPSNHDPFLCSFALLFPLIFPT